MTFERLDFAEGQLEELGVPYETHSSSLLGVVVPANWFVCSQLPAPGQRGKRVDLYVDRHCEWNW
jgi:hypothetical protein